MMPARQQQGAPAVQRQAANPLPGKQSYGTDAAPPAMPLLPCSANQRRSPKSKSEGWPEVLRARPLPVRCGAACCCRLGAACWAAVLGPARPRAGAGGPCAMGGM